MSCCSQRDGGHGWRVHYSLIDELPHTDTRPGQELLLRVCCLCAVRIDFQLAVAATLKEDCDNGWAVSVDRHTDILYG